MQHGEARSAILARMACSVDGARLRLVGTGIFARRVAPGLPDDSKLSKRSTPRDGLTAYEALRVKTTVSPGNDFVSGRLLLREDDRRDGNPDRR